MKRATALHDAPGGAVIVAADDGFVCLLDRVAAAVTRIEALPHDVLRPASPCQRSVEDLRLEQPALIVGCWASGCGTPGFQCAVKRASQRRSVDSCV